MFKIIEALVSAFWVFLHSLPIVSVGISLINQQAAQVLQVLSSLSYMVIFKDGPSYYPRGKCCKWGEEASP